MNYEKENRTDWTTTECIIGDLKLSVGSFFGPQSDEMIYFDFVDRKEHLFLKNFYDEDKLKSSEKKYLIILWLF